MTKPTSFFNYAFLSLSVLYWSQFTTASLITVEYFDDYCYYADFAVGVPSSTCIQHDSSSSVMFDCGSSGLIMYEYPSSTTCSSTPIQSTITTATDTGTCEDSSIFLPNPYFATPINDFKVTCDASENWIDNGYYYFKRTTSVLQASSAFDYTLEDCNQNDDSCLATVEYGYSIYCMIDPTTYMSYEYYRYNDNHGYFIAYSDSYCSSVLWSSEVNYDECFECSRFNDLVDEVHLGGLAAAAIIGIIIAIACCCCIVIAAVTICCFPAIMAGVIAFLCCRKQEPQQSTVVFQAVPQQPYGQPAQAAYGAPPHASLEMISVQIPMDAKPGQMITVSKSNGQQMHVQLPNDAVPGSVIQVQG